MNCAEWKERVALYAGGDLVEADVELHLAECEDCRAFCAGIRQTLDALRDEHRSDIAAAEFAAVRSRVIAEIERGRRVWQRLAWASGVGIAAAAALLAVFVRPAPLPAPPPRVAVSVPSVELVRSVEGPLAVARPNAAPPRHGREPIVVKLQTADPNIVIYWIAD
jgi:hypothetical protein